MKRKNTRIVDMKINGQSDIRYLKISREHIVKIQELIQSCRS